MPDLLSDDSAPGPGSSLASDRRWYAPELHPDYTAPPQAIPPEPTFSGLAQIPLDRGVVDPAIAIEAVASEMIRPEKVRTPSEVASSANRPWSTNNLSITRIRSPPRLICRLTQVLTMPASEDLFDLAKRALSELFVSVETMAVLRSGPVGLRRRPPRT